MEFGKESAIGLLKTYPMVFVCRTLSRPMDWLEFVVDLC